MQIDDLNINSWEKINSSGDYLSGYNGVFLHNDDSAKSILLIFKDEKENLHFVIEDAFVSQNDIINPKVNGLSIEIKKFRFIQSENINQFIDLKCSVTTYKNEFTEVIKEIAKEILVENIEPAKSIERVITRWQSFWGKIKSDILSENQLTGLLCELTVFKKLCEIKPGFALTSWKGPLNEKYDFLFTDWLFEVKGSRSNGHIHTINGIDQLKPINSKSLGLISFLVTKSNSQSAITLPDIIIEIESELFTDKPLLISGFRELLSHTGYSPINNDVYNTLKYEILDGRFFIVNEKFPRLTSNELKNSLDRRISDIRYSININDMEYVEFNKLLLGNYFY